MSGPVTLPDRPTDRVKASVPFAQVRGDLIGPFANDSSLTSKDQTSLQRPATGPRRQVRATHVDALAERLSERDWEITRSVARARVLTGEQVERLIFWPLSERTRARTRRAVLARLVRARVLGTLERRIGGVRGGSAGLVFALDVAGRRLLEWQEDGSRSGRVRRPRTPGRMFLAHALAVSEVWVALEEEARRRGARVVEFATEPASWQRNGRAWLRPDAYVVMTAGAITDYWWWEVDLGTESVPTIQRKLSSYLDFARRGGVGPHGIMPRVLVTVPTEARHRAVDRVLARLPDPADQLFHLTSQGEAAGFLVRGLQE